MLENTSFLTEYGWNTALSDRYDTLLTSGSQPGRILRVDRGRCDVAIATGIVRALSGSDPLCTGDWVTLTGDLGVQANGSEMHSVASVLPRSSCIVRSSASGRSEGQMLAANVDTVVIATAADGDVDLGRIERLLSLTWESGAIPVVVLTKADAAHNVSDRLSDVSAIAPGATVLAISAQTHEGMDVLDAVLDGTVAILGPSGAGKSTLANALLGSALLGRDRLDTGRVRTGDGKGRHTTVTRELIPFSGGRTLIDTPGLRGVGMWNAAEGKTRRSPRSRN